MGSDDNKFTNNANDHDIIKAFRRHNPPINGVTRSLIDVKNNLFYLFDASTGCILVTRSISFLSETHLKGYQVFKPVEPVLGDVSDLRAADNFGQVALITSEGLYILHLPHVQRRCNLPNHYDNVSEISSWLYEPDDRSRTFFEYKVSQARWDPHKPFHLIALFSDNTLRIVNTKSKKTIMTISLNEQPLSDVVSPTELAVDFDFLPELTGVEKSCSNVPSHVWEPLVVIKANGDILRIEISTNDPPQLEKVTVMPNPPSSACSLVVLHCQPPVIVIAEDSGTVYHTLMIKPTINPVLKVFEQYKLNSGFVISKPKMDSIKFVKDNLSSCRYFVAHDAGIHAALLPVVESVTSFLTECNCGDQEYSKLKQSIKNITSELKCVTCTLMPDLTTPQPIYGIGLIPHRLETFQIIVLQADASADAYFMDNIFPDSKYMIKRANINGLTLADNSDFFNVITTFLKNARNKRPSIMKVLQQMKNKTNLECYKIFLETTANLRKYGIEENKFVVNVIALKEQSLSGKLQLQLHAIDTLSKTKQELKRNAERIAERYEEINDKQISIMNKAKHVGLRLGGFNTVGYKKQVEEFLDVQRKSIHLQTKFNRLVGSLKRITEQNNGDDNNSENSFDVINRRVINAQLTEMNKNIKELKNRARTLA